MRRFHEIVLGEEGYTLIETVVAMALFLGVLIPMLVSVGNFLLDKKPDQLYHALRLAESEMSRISVNKDFMEERTKMDDFYIVNRKASRSEGVVTVIVEILDSKKTDKVLLKLQKSFLSYN